MKGNFLGKVSVQEYVVMCCHKIFKRLRKREKLKTREELFMMESKNKIR